MTTVINNNNSTDALPGSPGIRHQHELQGRAPPLSQGPCVIHSLIEPSVQGHVDEPLGILGVRPPADDVAGIVVMAAQGLHGDST